eukprot:TRINITY_DN22630_c0_g2_i1.p1 TRINITY_DN22630_c0_g2~~TRINITY_DN22630_c0_g2_i1.p1  ORF type:complete len:551 (+),score=89.46 TRINITY_DN22630_c0_g2_i1:103-1755(+)
MLLFNESSFGAYDSPEQKIARRQFQAKILDEQIAEKRAIQQQKEEERREREERRAKERERRDQERRDLELREQDQRDREQRELERRDVDARRERRELEKTDAISFLSPRTRASPRAFATEPTPPAYIREPSAPELSQMVRRPLRDDVHSIVASQLHDDLQRMRRSCAEEREQLRFQSEGLRAAASRLLIQQAQIQSIRPRQYNPEVSRPSMPSMASPRYLPTLTEVAKGAQKKVGGADFPPSGGITQLHGLPPREISLPYSGNRSDARTDAYDAQRSSASLVDRSTLIYPKASSGGALASSSNAPPASSLLPRFGVASRQIQPSLTEQVQAVPSSSGVLSDIDSLLYTQTDATLTATLLPSGSGSMNGGTEDFGRVVDLRAVLRGSKEGASIRDVRPVSPNKSNTQDFLMSALSPKPSATPGKPPLMPLPELPGEVTPLASAPGSPRSPRKGPLGDQLVAVAQSGASGKVHAFAAESVVEPGSELAEPTAGPLTTVVATEPQAESLLDCSSAEPPAGSAGRAAGGASNKLASVGLARRLVGIFSSKKDKG